MPLSWLAAGAPDQMPAARGPEMHQASLCAGTYPQGLRDANGLAVGRCGEEASAGFLLRGKQDRIQWSIFPLNGMAYGAVGRDQRVLRRAGGINCRHLSPVNDGVKVVNLLTNR